jgi:hypothetical protein
MPHFIGFEYEGDVDTGRRLTYQGDNVDAAVANCLYTERLTNGNAFVGPTKRVVHSGDRCIVFAGTFKRDEPACLDDPMSRTDHHVRTSDHPA